MNNSLWIEIIFWTALFIVFYTYFRLGHRALPARQAQRTFREPVRRVLRQQTLGSPEVTLFHHRLQRRGHRRRKVANSLELDYPEEKLHIVWVTDGSDDGTNERLRTRWEGKAPSSSNPNGREKPPP